MIVYDKLWETMEEKGISKYYLITKCGISPSLITRLKRNQTVKTETLNKLCSILNCNIEDIIEYKRGDFEDTYTDYNQNNDYI